MYIYTHTHMCIYSMCTGGRGLAQWHRDEADHIPRHPCVPPPVPLRGLAWFCRCAGTGAQQRCCRHQLLPVTRGCHFSESVQVADDSSLASARCSSAQSQVRFFISMPRWIISSYWCFKCSVPGALSPLVGLLGKLCHRFPPSLLSSTIWVFCTLCSLLSYFLRVGVMWHPDSISYLGATVFLDVSSLVF